MNSGGFLPRTAPEAAISCSLLILSIMALFRARTSCYGAHPGRPLAVGGRGKSEEWKGPVVRPVGELPLAEEISAGLAWRGACLLS